MANSSKEDISFLVRWRVVWNTTQKLYCSCRTAIASHDLGRCGNRSTSSPIQPFPNHSPSSVDDLAKIGGLGSPAPNVMQDSAENRFSSWSSQAEDAVFRQYAVRFPGYCAYEYGEVPPTLPDQRALEYTTQLAHLTQAKLSSPLIVVREKTTSPYPSWRRVCLVGQQGVIPLFDQQISLRIYLQETTGSPDDWPHLHRGSVAQQLTMRGLPEVALVSEPIPASLVFLFAQRLQDLTLGTGWTHSQSGVWDLTCLQHQRILGHCRNIRTWQDIPIRLQEAASLITTDSARTSGSNAPPHSAKSRSLGWVPHHGSSAPVEADPELPLVPLPPIDPQHPATSLPPLGWQVRFELQSLDLSPDVVDGLLGVGHAALYLECTKTNPKVRPSLWGELLFRWPRSLQRKDIPVHQLTPQRYLAIASLHGLHHCTREVLYDLLAFAALYPDISVRHLLIQKMGINWRLTAQWRQQLPSWLREIPPPRRTSWLSREAYWMGQLMLRVKGTVSGQELRDALYQIFSHTPPTVYDRCEYPPPNPRRPARKF